MKKKPDDWLKTEEFKHITILDPDGWDRSNYDVDWNIPITREEMWNKTMMCTISSNKKYNI